MMERSCGRKRKQRAVRSVLALLVLMIAPMARAQTDLVDLNSPAIKITAPAHDFLDAAAMAGRRIVVAGEHGLIAYSDDDGVTWHQSQVPVSVLLTSMAFANPKDGWAVGHMGVILHTSDGGATWQKQIDGLDVEKEDLTAAAAVNTSLPTAALAMRRATMFQKNGPDRPFLAVLAQSHRRAIVVGAYRMAMRTNDGGKVWDDMSLDILDRLSHNLYGIAAIGSKIYISAETGIVFRSANGGATFSEVTQPVNATLFGVTPTADGSILVYGVAGAAFLSHDEGKTWNRVNINTSSDITAGLLLKSGAILLASGTGSLYLSRDNGQRFKSLSQIVPMLLTDLVQMPDGDVVVTGSRGVKILPKSDFSKAK